MQEAKTFFKPAIFKLEEETGDYVEVLEISKFIELTGLPSDSEHIEELLDMGKVKSWTEYPYLIIDPETLEILGHEGRHRLIAMQKSGYTHAEIIIQIQPDPSRFSIENSVDMDSLFNWQWNGNKPDIGNINSQSYKY